VQLTRTRLGRCLAAAALLSSLASAATAEDWPAHPVTLVIPLAAGGGSDGLVRVFTPRLGELLGQQIIVENVGGAGGMIGAARVAKAAPDGYQILLGTSGTQALNQSLYAQPLYDAATDFEPVSLISEVPQVLMTRKDFPANNLKEFVAYSKSHQGSMQFGSSGRGGTGHVGCAMLNAAVGIEVTHVPYRGGGPAMTDLIGGRIDYQCALVNIAKPQIDSGQAKGIALLTTTRSPIMPELATTQEQGLAGFDASAWNGIFLPKGTPRAIVDKLHTAIVATMATPAVRDRLREFGATMMPPERQSAAYLQTFVESEIAKGADVMKAAKLVPQ
jgi:tripartite-type tricarboxylate transporter receptor subunit TctC